MLIDWFTVGAQLLNFLILVWLMKRYLYKPILQAIDEREKRIASELADADAKQSEAKKEREEFQQKNEEFTQQREAMMGKATQEVKTERQRLLDDARTAADALSAKRLESMKSEEKSLQTAIHQRTQQEAFAISRKVLKELSATSLEGRIVDVFTSHVRELSGKVKSDLAEALKNTSDPSIVRSAFDLMEEQRTTIQRALNETFSSDISLRYETTPELVGGIELTSHGQKVAWSISDSLTSLEKNAEELFNSKDRRNEKEEAKNSESKLQ